MSVVQPHRPNRLPFAVRPLSQLGLILSLASALHAVPSLADDARHSVQIAAGSWAARSPACQPGRGESVR